VRVTVRMQPAAVFFAPRKSKLACTPPGPSTANTLPLTDFATVWSELFPTEQARIVQLLVERVDVQGEALEVRIRAEGLASLVGELRQGNELTARAA
jgi:hypothetical protein